MCKAKTDRSWLGGSGNAVLGQSFDVSQAQSLMLQQMNAARNKQQSNFSALGMDRASNAAAIGGAVTSGLFGSFNF